MDHPPDTGAAVPHLVAGLLAEPWGQISPSVYETGRLVVLAPWLDGHSARVDFLVRAQSPDGTWGGPDGYCLVPTLSATEALLTEIRRGAARYGTAPLADAVDRGLKVLFGLLPNRLMSIPDTPAIEIIVPWLVTSLNDHLDRYPGWWGSGRLRLPAGLDLAQVDAVRHRLAGTAAVPEKVLHSLEVFGVVGAPGTIRPVPPGTVGASPAATAAWLSTRPAPSSDTAIAASYLKEVAGRHGGPVPSVIPVTVFERAWVLNAFALADLTHAGQAELIAGLKVSLGPYGTPGGAGLPADADTTSAVLFALAHHGLHADVGCLWPYHVGTHFCTWQGERTASATTNAHVLEAFGSRMLTEPRYRSVAEDLSDWLCDQQQPDGSWTDKWHASPYYATACCVLALHRFGGAVSASAVGRATEWVLSTQYADGSWGKWDGTAEETAYAMQILLVAGVRPDRRRVEAAARGYRFLRLAVHQSSDPPLWHDKDLYLPVAVVRAATLSALRLARRSEPVMAWVDRQGLSPGDSP